jgi:hypothetical protein
MTGFFANVRAVLAASLSLGCVSTKPEPSLGPSPCPLTTGGTSFEADHPETLVGEYEITLIATASDVAGRRSSGHLSLRVTTQRPVSVDSFAIGVARPAVIGWSDIQLNAVAACTNGNPNSRDPTDPGVVHTFEGHLRLGSGTHLDGCGTVLIVQEQGPSGFRGQWDSYYSLAYRVDSKGRPLRDRGWLCAVRSDSAPK